MTDPAGQSIPVAAHTCRCPDREWLLIATRGNIRCPDCGVGTTWVRLVDPVIIPGPRRWPPEHLMSPEQRSAYVAEATAKATAFLDAVLGQLLAEPVAA